MAFTTEFTVFLDLILFTCDLLTLR